MTENYTDYTRQRYSPDEKETIIQFDQGSPTAIVYTHEKTWQQHIQKNLGIKPSRNLGSAREYEIPKKWIKLPRKPSEARRVAGRLRAQKQPVGILKNPIKPPRTPNAVAKSAG